MGWISKRHMESGGSLYEGGPKKKGPLRKVVRVLVPSQGLFSSERVLLECGHETEAWGGIRAICEKCGKELREG